MPVYCRKHVSPTSWDKRNKPLKIWDTAFTSRARTIIRTRLNGVLYATSVQWGYRKQKHCHPWTATTQTGLQALSVKQRRERSAQDHRLCRTETRLRCGAAESQAPQLKGHISQHVRDSAFAGFLSCFTAAHAGEMVQERSHLWPEWKQGCAHCTTSETIYFN